MIIVSACLAGLATRYDGKACADPEVVELVARGEALPVCPEQLGGLPTPRPRIFLEAGDGEAVMAGRARAVDELGMDRRGSLVQGAQEVLRLARLTGAGRAILKDKSPSCGVHRVWVDGRCASGFGVCAFLLKGQGVELEAR